VLVVAVGFRLWMADVRAGELVAWGLALLVLAVLAYLSQLALDRNLALEAERQASLLRAISDIGEGLVVTENGRYLAANAAYQELTGYDSAELAAMESLVDLAPLDERKRLADELATRPERGDLPFRYESALIRKDGQRIQVETAVRRLGARGKHRLLALVHDISDRHRMAEAERESETRFRTLFEQAQAGMAFAGLDGHITTVNPAFSQLVGYSHSELRKLSLLDITYPEDVAALQDELRRMLAGEDEGTRTESRYTRKDGEPVWVDLTTRLVRGPDNRPLYLQAVAVDLRDRKRAEVLQAARFAVTQALVTSPGWEKACAGRSTGSWPSTGRSIPSARRCTSSRPGSVLGAIRPAMKQRPQRPATHVGRAWRAACGKRVRRCRCQMSRLTTRRVPPPLPQRASRESSDSRCAAAVGWSG
jgi:PAS domain S-box-containing protein